MSRWHCLMTSRRKASWWNKMGRWPYITYGIAYGTFITDTLGIVLVPWTLGIYCPKVCCNLIICNVISRRHYCQFVVYLSLCSAKSLNLVTFHKYMCVESVSDYSTWEYYRAMQTARMAECVTVTIKMPWPRLEIDFYCLLSWLILVIYFTDLLGASHIRIA